MKKIKEGSPAQGAAGTTIATAFILSGIIVTFNLWEIRWVWGLALIITGLSFFAGLMVFGTKSDKD